MDIPFSYDDNKELILFTSLAHENTHSVINIYIYIHTY